jgi:4-aminobutyrate aminotransferase-like enzyme
MCYAWTATRLENLRHTSFNGDGVGRGMLLSTGGLLHNVIKIKPPMSLNADEVYMVVRAFDDELSAMEG